MPRYKLTDRNRQKMVYVYKQCPCIKKSLLAYIFDISPSRVGEVLREEHKKEVIRLHIEFIEEQKDHE